MWWPLLILAIAIGVGWLVIPRMLHTAAGRRPESDTDRDQLIAELRTFSNQRPKEGEPTWDGTKRTTIPTEPGTGVD